MAKAAEKLSRKDVPPTDPVAEKLRPLTDGFERHWRTIVIVAGACFVALAAIAVWLKLQGDHREEAAQVVGDALELVERPVVSAEPEAEPKAKPGTKATAKKPDSDSFASEQQKQEAIAQKAKAAADAYATQPAGRVALLTLADAQYKLGKYPEAVETYNHFLTVMPEGDDLRAYGALGLAYALLAQGKKEDALAVAQGLAARPPGNFGKDLGLLAVGHIAEDLGKPDIAKDAYKRLRTEIPESAAGREASARLVALGEPPPSPVATPTPAPVAAP